MATENGEGKGKLIRIEIPEKIKGISLHNLRVIRKMTCSAVSEEPRWVIFDFSEDTLADMVNRSAEKRGHSLGPEIRDNPEIRADFKAAIDEEHALIVMVKREEKGSGIVSRKAVLEVALSQWKMLFTPIQFEQLKRKPILLERLNTANGDDALVAALKEVREECDKMALEPKAVTAKAGEVQAVTLVDTSKLTGEEKKRALERKIAENKERGIN